MGTVMWTPTMGVLFYTWSGASRLSVHEQRGHTVHSTKSCGQSICGCGLVMWRQIHHHTTILAYATRLKIPRGHIVLTKMALWLHKTKHCVYHFRQGAIKVVDRSLVPNISHRLFDLAVYRPLYSSLDVFRLVRWVMRGRPIHGVVYTSAYKH